MQSVEGHEPASYKWVRQYVRSIQPTHYHLHFSCLPLQKRFKPQSVCSGILRSAQLHLSTLFFARRSGYKWPQPDQGKTTVVLSCQF